jgi:ubiquinone/menaquinone biosynthesis C-methylase UbiE
MCLRQGAPEKIASLLDIGCGPDPWFLRFPKKLAPEAKIVALDQEPFIFSYPGLSFVQLQVKESLPFPDSGFDCVSLLAVIEHLDFPNELFKEIYRVLRPEGKVILTTPTKLIKPIWETLARLRLIKDTADEHQQYFSKTKLESLLRQTGFIIEKSIYFELGLNLFIRARK